MSPSPLFKYSLALATVASSWTVVGSAHAANIELDFTDMASFATSDSNPGGSQSWTGSKDGITVTVTAGPSTSNLHWDSGDGFGVNTDTWYNSIPNYEDDEVEGTESLTINFGQEVDLVSMNLSDLFNESSCSWCSSYLEQGYYSIDGSAPISFFADPGQVLGNGAAGAKSVAINQAATTIVLTAPGKNYKGGGSEFSLSGFIVSTAAAAVPELSAAGFGSALALVVGFGMIAIGRRRSAGSALLAG